MELKISFEVGFIGARSNFMVWFKCEHYIEKEFSAPYIKSIKFPLTFLLYKYSVNILKPTALTTSHMLSMFCSPHLSSKLL